MRIIKLRQSGKLEVKNIKNDLRVLQNEVGGYIEEIQFTDDMILLVDENARMKMRSKNPYLHTLRGDIVLCGVKHNKLCSIPLLKVAKLVRVFGKKAE